MRKTLCMTLLALCVAGAGAGEPEASGEDALARLLIRKGILTEEEYRALKREAEGVAAAPPAEPAPRGAAPAGSAMTDASVSEAVDRLRDEVREELRRRDEGSIALALTVEGQGRWRARDDVGDRRSGSTSDLFLRSASLALEARPLDALVARLVLKSEWLGADTTDQGQEADPSVAVDEGTITLGSGEFPLYGVVGQRTQPFGAFYSHLVTDPMSQSAYEVKQVGATLGIARNGPWGLLDASVTVYRQEEQLAHLFTSGLFDGAAVIRTTAAGLRKEQDDLGSAIVAVTLTPFKDLMVGAGYLTEPGDGRRNQTLGLWGVYTWRALTVEAELLGALARERYVLAATGERLDTSFLEKVLVVGLAYRPLRALEVAGRYECFWDDGLAAAAETWSARNRLSLGAGYLLVEREAISVRLVGEYRFTDLRREGLARETAAPRQDEVLARLSVTYR